MHDLYIDVETQKLSDEVGGWHNVHLMKLAIAVTYSTHTEQFHVYHEQQVDQLIQQLCQADRIVGFNIYRFDFTVLQPYTQIPLHQLPHLDLLIDIESVLGHRVRLDNCARSTLGISKSGDGVQAVQWFREGQIERVIQYCQQDVEILVRLHEYGRQNGHVCYMDRYGEVHRVPVNW